MLDGKRFVRCWMLLDEAEGLLDLCDAPGAPNERNLRRLNENLASARRLIDEAQGLYAHR